MTGGDFVVESASKNGNDNAVITMKTDNSGIDTKDSGLITRVLNSLAGKLIYDGYTRWGKKFDRVCRNFRRTDIFFYSKKRKYHF